MTDNDKMTFNDKLALFDQPNYRKSTNFDFDPKERKLLNSFEKKRQIFQPRKTIVSTNNPLSINIKDTKKREKRENKYQRTEREKINKVYKPNSSSAERKKKEKKNDIYKTTKIYEPKDNSKNKINEISVFTNNNNISVSEKIKLLNKNEEKNKMSKYPYNNNNKTTKGTIKSIEKVNPSNFKEIKTNQKEKEEKINNNNFYKINNYKDINNNNINNNYNNKRKNNNTNTNYIKEIKEIQNKPQNERFNENLQIFNKNNQKVKEPKKINNENKKKNSHYHHNHNHHNENFNDLVAIFSQNIDKNKEKKIPKKENYKKEEYFNLNINKEIEKNEINNKKNNEINSNIFIKKPLKPIKDLLNFNNKSFSEEIKKPSSPKAKTKTNNIINDNKVEIKRLSKQNNQNDNLPKNIENKEELGIIKKEKKVKNTRASKSQPKIKPKNEAKKDNNVDMENKYEILKIQPIKPEFKTNSFCKAFFIASFPKTNNQIVENSEGVISDCGHEVCSSLPGFEPEIIYKYPEIDSKELEINNMLASICFPNSIKVCYSNEEDKISSVKNYSCCFTNQVGDRYYGMTYHFYARLTNNDFCKNYNTNLFEKIATKYSGEIDENLDSKTKIINDINSRKYVYIPYCICLVSKYTYFPWYQNIHIFHKWKNAYKVFYLH